LIGHYLATGKKQQRIEMAVNYLCQKCKNTFALKHKKCPKCGAVVPKHGKVYYVRVMVNGRRICKTVPGSLELARQIESKIKSELVAGDYYDRRQARKENTPFPEYMEKKYLPWAKENKASSSYAREESIYRLWIKPTIGNKPLKDVSPFVLERMKKVMKDAGKAPRTIEYALAIVRQAFNKAILWDIYKGDNPVSKVSKPKTDNRRIRFLSPEEAKMVLEESQKRSKQMYEICTLALYCGLRASEIINLTWADIDLENEIIYVKDPKNKTNRAAYMTEEVIKIFQEKEKGQPDEHIFPSYKTKVQEISHFFKEIVDSLGLNDGVSDPRQKVVFHTLRHTFASWLAIQGTPLHVIKELLGHKTLAMTERYSHLIPDTKREAVKGLQKMLKKETGVVRLK